MPVLAVISSAAPELAGTTTGVPHAIDSSAARPNASRGLGAIVTSASPNASAIDRRSVTRPRKRTGRSRHSELGPGSPSPITVRLAALPLAMMARSVAIAVAVESRAESPDTAATWMTFCRRLPLIGTNVSRSTPSEICTTPGASRNSQAAWALGTTMRSATRTARRSLSLMSGTSVQRAPAPSA